MKETKNVNADDIDDRAFGTESKLWYPIETAPKDGTIILGWCCHYVDKDCQTAYAINVEGFIHADNGVNLIYWRNSYKSDGRHIPAWWCLTYENGTVAANPTHWMPLPKAPNGGAYGTN
jgi:hypothetical protein